MADDGNEDSWLYGSRDEEGGESVSAVDGEAEDAKKESISSQDSAAVAPQSDEAVKEESSTDKSAPANGDDPMETGEPEEVVPNPADEMEEADREDGERLSGGEEAENSESEEDDDDINVVIGDIKSGPNYNIKQRSGAAAAGTAPATDKAAKQAAGGKFSMEEFESVGTINGTPSHEFSIDSLDEKPWRKPGADITDYFNYGFNEDTWRMYCERQKRMRQNESGVGLQGLMVAPVMMSHNQADRSAGPGGRTLTPIANDNSKYGALTALPVNRRAGPPPGRRMTGAIDVIGGNGVPMGGKQENVIQVMTAERREYSRPGMPPGGKFDMPPPVFPPGGPGCPPGGPPGPPGRNMGPGGPENSGPIIDAFQDEFSYGYEPTQDSQWGAGHGNQGWAPSGIKELTPMMPQMVPAPGMGMPPDMVGMPPGMQGVPPPQQRYSGSDRGPTDRDRSMRGERSEREREARERGERERERERERSGRDADKDRGSDRRSERETSRRRDRSRSRERSRRRSRSKDKSSGATSSSTTSTSSSRHRERSSRSEKRDKEDTRKDKKRDEKEPSE